MLGDASPDTGHLALDLLITSGNVKGIEAFALAHDISSDTKKKALAEAGIQSAIDCMAEEAEGGIDGERFMQYFSRQPLIEYFTLTTNTPLLEKIVDVLYAGTHASMEAYAQITAVDVLRAPALTAALRRNLTTPSLKDKMTGLIRSSYAVVFSSSNIDAETVNSYFPVINLWKDLVDPREIAEQTITALGEDESLDSYLRAGYNQEFFNAALNKLIELTDRTTMSRLMHQHFSGSSAYRNLVEAGTLESVVRLPGQQASEDVEKAIAAYEEDSWPGEYDVKRLAKQLKGKGKEALSRRLAEWFAGRRTQHALALVNYKEQLYDVEIAQRELTSCIVNICRAHDLSRLQGALSFPEQLIDFSRPELQQFTEAYRIHKKTHEKMESEYL